MLSHGFPLYDEQTIQSLYDPMMCRVYQQVFAYLAPVCNFSLRCHCIARFELPPPFHATLLCCELDHTPRIKLHP
jgi:hypothetical protein